METLLNKEIKPSKKEKVARATLVTKKIEPEVCKALQALKDQIDDKPIGRRIRDSEVVKLALSLIRAEHIAELKESTYSSQDRLILAHQEFVKQNGEATLEDFIDRLLRQTKKCK